MANKNLAIIFFIALAIIGCNSQANITTDNYLINLPEKPSDFKIIQRDVYSGAFPDICRLEKEYYLQPEFYPNWENQKSFMYDNHDFTRWGVYGYGAYPAKSGIQVENLKAGEKITFCTFLKTSYGIETYQGIQIEPESNKYFNVVVDPSIMLLNPTFPEFNENWVKKITITIIAKQDIPIGTYNIGFDIVNPPKDIEKEFVWQVLDNELKLNSTYKQRCQKYLNNRNPDKEVNQECEDLFMLRQNKYVSGGTWDTGNIFSAVIEVKA